MTDIESFDLAKLDPTKKERIINPSPLMVRMFIVNSMKPEPDKHIIKTWLV
jgi:hypothetical protein